MTPHLYRTYVGVSYQAYRMTFKPVVNAALAKELLYILIKIFTTQF